MIVFDGVVVGGLDDLQLLECLPDEGGAEGKDNAEVYSPDAEPGVEAVRAHKGLLHSEVEACAQQFVPAGEQASPRLVADPELAANNKIADQ